MGQHPSGGRELKNEKMSGNNSMPYKKIFIKAYFLHPLCIHIMVLNFISLLPMYSKCHWHFFLVHEVLACLDVCKYVHIVWNGESDQKKSYQKLSNIFPSSPKIELITPINKVIWYCSEIKMSEAKSHGLVAQLLK